MTYNVLIVDDSATMRALIRKVLVISGFATGECFEGGNGQEALDILRNNRVDLIFADLHMPEMDGAAFLKVLRNHHHWRSIPVVLITTEGRPEVLNPVLRQRVQGYIRKPFQPETIRKHLINILGEAAASHVGKLEGCDF
jgi:two-component system chemotaxis response regulator CheY